MTTSDTSIQVIPFRDDLAVAFDRLNRDWLVAGNFLEPADEVYLVAPRSMIVDKGGEVFFAVEGPIVHGTAAAVPLGNDVFELAKVGVSPAAKGRGLGRLLVTSVIEFARSRGARQVVLTSNSRLVPALTLYRSLGFVERPCPPGFGYETADIYMELTLSEAAPG